MTDFARLLHAEWTKFRTVRGWVVAIVIGAAGMVGLGLTSGMGGSCNRPESRCEVPVGPDGEEVTDSFTFAHQALTGDGSLTVQVESMTGVIPGGPEDEQPRSRLAPWAKAGLIIKDGTRQGSTYAAVMVTGGNGVRMQYDYTHDRAGQPGAAPRWLRLTRTGDTITGYESADGVEWSTVGTARLPKLSSTVEVGLFVASPQYAEATGVGGAFGGPTKATATFKNVGRQGNWATGPQWTVEIVGEPAGRDIQPGDGATLSGSGDIAPAVAGATGLGTTITQTLVGTFAGLILVVVVGVMFVTAEYRRGLLSTTVAANPGRGRVLAAKASVAGAVAFGTGLISAAVVVTFGPKVLRDNGAYVHPASTGTEIRLIVGTAALLAVAAVLAVGLGVLLRRSAAAVTAAIVGVVLPYLLAVSVLPVGAARWMLRVTPAAAFAVQQSMPEYHQVANLYLPAEGYFPLAPWAGFAVLSGWAALVLGLAAYAFRRRDA